MNHKSLYVMQKMFLISNQFEPFNSQTKSSLNKTS